MSQNIQTDLFSPAAPVEPQQPAQQQPDVTQQPAGEVQQPTQQPQFDEDAMRRVAETVLQSQQQQKEEQRELTPEEQAEYLKVWNPSEEFVNDFANSMQSEDPAARIAAITEFRDGIMQQAFRAAELQAEQRFNALQQQFAPLLQQQAEQGRAQAAEAFVTKYPALKGMEDMAHTVADQLISTGQKFNSQEELFTAVANQLETMAKQFNPNFSLASEQPGQQNAQPQNQQPSAMPQMASTAVATQQGSSQSAAGSGLKRSVW